MKERTNNNPNFDYFVQNHEHLFSTYPNKYLVISGCDVKAAKDSLEDAVAYTIDNQMPLGSFIIQQCTEGESAYTQTYHSRVVFA